MLRKYFIWAFLAVGLFYAGATYGMGLAVGVFGGYAVPTGGMAAEEGFALRESGQISGKVLLNVNNRYSLEIGTGYHFGYPPSKKDYYWVEDTKAVTVTGGANFKVNLWKIALYGSGGAGYYFIDTRVVSTVEEDGLGGWAYPVEVSIDGAGIYCGGR
ncbi:MAG TPA: hypothetical protein VMX79_00305 [bacterium]|nr:hypothetical protein [bacterium]